MQCLDTNIVVDFFRGDARVNSWMESMAAQGEFFSVTMLTVCELYKGVFLSAHRDEHKRQLESFLRTVQVLDLTVKASEVYGQIYEKLKSAGKPTQDFDLLIAAIVIAHNRTFITKDIKDFRNIPGIKIGGV